MCRQQSSWLYIPTLFRTFLLALHVLILYSSSLFWNGGGRHLPLHASEPPEPGPHTAARRPFTQTDAQLQPFIADLLSPHSESSSPGTILYLSEDAPPDFISGFAEDNGIRIGKPHVQGCEKSLTAFFLQRRCLLQVAPGVQENNPSLVKARYFFEQFSHKHLTRV